MYERIPSVPGVYLITNTVSGKVYVGSSTNMRSRIQGHRTQLRNGKHGNALLKRAWNKHGASAFTASALRICERAQLRNVEQAVLDATGAASRERGYNLKPKAEFGRWMPHTEETKRKIGAANKVALTGRKGRPMPAHVQEILTAARRRAGWPQPHVLQAAVAANRGNKFHLGHKHDSQTRARMSAKTRGERHPHAVLTEHDVREVRRLYDEDGISGTTIAKRYGLHNSTIYALLNGKSWRHVAKETTTP